MDGAPETPRSGQPPSDASPASAKSAASAVARPASEQPLDTPVPERLGEWRPAEDVIQVVRSPRPGATRGTWRAFRETARGLRTVFGQILRGPTTVQYPEEKVPVFPRFRGRHKLHRFEDIPHNGAQAGLEKCVGCSLCAAACPADCIRVVAAENTPENRVSAGERYAAVYEINLAQCIFCGYCEAACPFDAITMGHDYELSDYDREDLIFTKEMLLAEAIERTPLRNEDE